MPMPPELTHAALQQAFHAALWGDGLPEGIVAPDPAEAEQRFKVYRNNVSHSLTRALAAQFPVIEALVGAAFFAALARAFFKSSPPRSPSLLLWGDDFAAFLAHFPPVAHLPYLADVARLEYARACACHAADAEQVQPETLAVGDPARLQLGLHPSVSLFAAATPAVQIWLAHQDQSAPQTLTPGPDHALIARRPDFEVIVSAIDAGTHAVLTALLAGKSLGDAAALSDTTAALTLLLRHGLIISTGEA